MSRHFVAYAAVIFAMSCLLAGCGSVSTGASSPLVGTWETESAAGMQFRYVFESDGTMQSASIMGGMTSPQTGTWQVVDATGDAWVVQFELNRGRRAAVTEEMHIQFRDNDHITMVPAGAGDLADQLARHLARVSY